MSTGIGLAREDVRKALKRPNMTGAEELRLILKNMDNTVEWANDGLTAEELIQLYRMQLVAEWDFYPDQWTARQRKEALEGKPPRWDDKDNPVYEAA